MYLAQVTTTYSQSSTSAGVGIGLLVFYLLVLVVAIAAVWKLFEKAGQEGWKAIIPIYSSVILLRIVGMSGWYVLLLLIPGVNIIFAIYMYNKLSKAFGYGVGMTILLCLAIGVLILGFGKAKYLGPNGGAHAPAAPAAPAA